RRPAGLQATARADLPRRRARPPRSGPRPPSRCGSASPFLDRLLDSRIRAAAADVSGHPMPDLVHGRVGRRSDERRGGYDLAGRAEPALHRVGLDECADERMVTQTLDRGDLTVDVVGERDARQHRYAVDLHRARSAMPLVARDLRAGEAKLLAEELREARPDG